MQVEAQKTITRVQVGSLKETPLAQDKVSLSSAYVHVHSFVGNLYDCVFICVCCVSMHVGESMYTCAHVHMLLLTWTSYIICLHVLLWYHILYHTY